MQPNLIPYSVNFLPFLGGGRNLGGRIKDLSVSNFIPYSITLIPNYTLNLKCMISPSCTTYSLPSIPSLPASLIAASDLYSI